MTTEVSTNYTWSQVLRTTFQAAPAFVAAAAGIHAPSDRVEVPHSRHAFFIADVILPVTPNRRIAASTQTKRTRASEAVLNKYRHRVSAGDFVRLTSLAGSMHLGGTGLFDVYDQT